MLKLGIDLGGSETRVAASQTEITCISSQVHEVLDTSVMVKDFIEDRINDITIIHAPYARLKGRRFVKGSLANFYSTRSLYLDNDQFKVKQEVTYINLIHGITMHLIETRQNNQEIALCCCIPASEYFETKNALDTEFKQAIAGDYEIHINGLGTAVKFKILPSRVLVSPEGVAALTPFLFVSEDFRKADILIVDAGYNTTDITPIIGGKPHGMGSRSYRIGGSNLIAMVSAALGREGIEVSDLAIQESMSSGLLEVSGGNIPIKGYRDTAYSVFIPKLVRSIRQVLQASMLTIDEFSYILFVGGPLTDTEKQDEILNSLGAELTVIDLTDPREANVKGAVAQSLRAFKAET